jgi:hypothetical protein
MPLNLFEGSTFDLPLGLTSDNPAVLGEARAWLAALVYDPIKFQQGRAPIYAAQALLLDRAHDAQDRRDLIPVPDFPGIGWRYEANCSCEFLVSHRRFVGRQLAKLINAA